MNTTTSIAATDIRYGLSCERTRVRTAAIRSVIACAAALRAAWACDEADGCVVPSDHLKATRAALDAAERRAAAALPAGLVGGIILAAARTGSVPGLD